MTYVATSNTSDKVILSDHVTPASGIFGIYLNPEKIGWNDEQKPVSEVSTGSDESTSTMFGANELVIRFNGCTYPKDGSGGDWEKFQRAKGYWSDSANNNLLYLQILDKDSYNIAKYPVTPYTGMAQIRGRIGVTAAELDLPNNYRFNVIFKRDTS